MVFPQRKDGREMCYLWWSWWGGLRNFTLLLLIAIFTIDHVNYSYFANKTLAVIFENKTNDVTGHETYAANSNQNLFHFFL